MVNKENFIIIYLSLSLLFVQFMWLKAERKAEYLQGQKDVYHDLSEMSPEAEPYLKHPKGHK